MATMMHPFQKAEMDNNNMRIHTCYFADKFVARGPKLDLIIAPLEVYIDKMLIFNRKCLTCICVAYKSHQNIFWALD